MRELISFHTWLESRQLTFDFMKTPKVTPEDVKKMHLFGPVYHGTDQKGHEGIGGEGFRVFVGSAAQGNLSNGYLLNNYYGGIPAPIHHIGFGTYFTTTKSIAKMFNHGTTRGLKPYYLHVPRLETINFGAPKTMMNWWQKNGYDMKPVDWTKTAEDMPIGGRVIRSNPQEIEKKRIQATINMTNTLKAKYDAVWFKGKGFKRLLDGDQICVYDPNNIYELSTENYKGVDIGNGIFIKAGDRFVVKGTNATAVMKGLRKIDEEYRQYNTWEGIGRSEYYLEIGNLKNWDDFKRVYEQYIIDKAKERYSKRDTKDITQEQFIDHTIKYEFKNTYNFPSVLVGRVLKKGERFIPQ